MHEECDHHEALLKTVTALLPQVLPQHTVGHIAGVLEERRGAVRGRGAGLQPMRRGRVAAHAQGGMDSMDGMVVVVASSAVCHVCSLIERGSQYLQA